MTRWIAADFQPITVVEDVGFKSVMNTNQRCHSISGSEITDCLLQINVEVTEHPENKLQSAPVVAVTIDCWSVEQVNSCASFTAY